MTDSAAPEAPTASPPIPAALSVTDVRYPLARTFAISRGSKTQAHVITVTLTHEGRMGRGEAVPYARYGETVEGTLAQVASLADAIAAGLTRQKLQDALPPGAARCAIDCALWDLEAKLTGIPVWQRAGLPPPRLVLSAETIVLDTPEAMAVAAGAARSTLLKLKLGGPDDFARVEAVHRAAPSARLILDANEGLSPRDFDAICKRAASLGVVLIEQPFPAGKDAHLRAQAAPVAICADESVHTHHDVEALAARYDVVNVKLDKAGGLTEGLALVRAARRAGLGVMIGCMVGSSLSMAPAVLLAGLCDAADLDGPLWLANDIAGGLRYENGQVAPPDPAFWGG
jgi:L-alanine-DL-glutamate epimerase-like enolase superfamily enzyme